MMRAALIFLTALAVANFEVASSQRQPGLRPVFRGRSTGDRAPGPQARQLECGNSSSSAFELLTGFTMKLDDDANTPGQQLADPSVVLKEARLLKLADCLAKCKADKDCKSVNYETGLCVMLRDNADSRREPLVESQSPVFTEYGQKVCLKEAKACNKPWAWERVDNYALSENHSAKKIAAGSRIDCAELCLNERTFVCRSANYNPETGECSLSLMSRYTLKGQSHFVQKPGSVYLENNCVDQAIRMCEFHKLPGRILKTVDSIYEEVENVEECRELCLGDKERCNSYDYGDVGDKVCRLSHHTAATLTFVEEPYQSIETATTYEMSACYNIEIDCRAKAMVAKIKSTRLFDGKVYAKGNPVGCLSDVKNSLSFELQMPYDDEECNVLREQEGIFLNELIIQHHDKIVTQADLALAVRCEYDLSNRTVSNNVSLEVQSKIDTITEERGYAESPEVYMSITDRKGGNLTFARVGDPLSLVFGIVNQNTPYDLFVRKLVATDGTKENQIELIDEDGCPTDVDILGPVERHEARRATLLTKFDAFKFSGNSDVVLFAATLSFCVNGECPPRACQLNDYAGRTVEVDSFGRRKRDVSKSRKRRNSNEEMTVIQSITISDRHVPRKSDKFSAPEPESLGPAQTTYSESDSIAIVSSPSHGSSSQNGYCVNMVGLMVACSLFLVAQLVVIVAWTYVWQKKRRSKLDESPMPEATGDSLTQLFQRGYPARRF